MRIMLTAAVMTIPNTNWSCDLTTEFKNKT